MLGFMYVLVFYYIPRSPFLVGSSFAAKFSKDLFVVRACHELDCGALSANTKSCVHPKYP